MNKELLPSRKERHKKEDYISWYTTLFLFGVYWIIYFFTPNNIKSIWTMLLTGAIAMALTATFEKIKLPTLLKWLITLILCIVSAILNFGLM